MSGLEAGANGFIGTGATSLRGGETGDAAGFVTGAAVFTSLDGRVVVGSTPALVGRGDGTAPGKLSGFETGRAGKGLFGAFEGWSNTSFVGIEVGSNVAGIEVVSIVGFSVGDQLIGAGELGLDPGDKDGGVKGLFVPGFPVGLFVKVESSMLGRAESAIVGCTEGLEAFGGGIGFDTGGIEKVVGNSVTWSDGAAVVGALLGCETRGALAGFEVGACGGEVVTGPCTDKGSFVGAAGERTGADIGVSPGCSIQGVGALLGAGKSVPTGDDVLVGVGSLTGALDGNSCSRVDVGRVVASGPVVGNSIFSVEGVTVAATDGPFGSKVGPLLGPSVCSPVGLFDK